MSYSENYDNPEMSRYNSVYLMMQKNHPKDLEHLLRTGLLLTPGRDNTESTGNYRKFPGYD